MTAVVLRGDARALPLPDASVDLVVTSPPYFGLRSYTDDGEHYDGQIGSEATPAEWLAALLGCTREWMRVLKPSGSIFVNLGDKFAGGGQGGNVGGNLNGGPHLNRTPAAARNVPQGFQAKSLMGLPWRYAIGCTDQLGLILRRDIIWSKPNGLPESVTDRCRSSHEYLFHLVRQPRYYAAVDEIREPHAAPPKVRGIGGYDGANGQQRHGFTTDQNPLGKLPGSVWSIPSQPLTVPAALGVDHFAAFPMEFPRRVILGWSPPGICTACGEGRRPVSDASRTIDGKPVEDLGAWKRGRFGTERHHLGYACACPQPAAPVRPALVVDPFGGTGTTALVAAAYGRTGVSVDLSGDYCRLARWRTADPAERARALQVAKPPPVPDGQGSLFDDEAV